jgi:hypothetical protein
MDWHRKDRILTPPSWTNKEKDRTDSLPPDPAFHGFPTVLASMEFKVLKFDYFRCLYQFEDDT